MIQPFLWYSFLSFNRASADAGVAPTEQFFCRYPGGLSPGSFVGQRILRIPCCAVGGASSSRGLFRLHLVLRFLSLFGFPDWVDFS